MALLPKDFVSFAVWPALRLVELGLTELVLPCCASVLVVAPFVLAGVVLAWLFFTVEDALALVLSLLWFC